MKQRNYSQEETVIAEEVNWRNTKETPCSQSSEPVMPGNVGNDGNIGMYTYVMEIDIVFCCLLHHPKKKRYNESYRK